MKAYCLKCKKDTENINPKVSKTSNGRTMLLSNCAICNSKKSRFIKNQEAKRQFHMRKLKIMFLKVSQDLQTTLDYESTIFKGFCKTN